MRLLKAKALAQLGQVASGSATQDLWLKDKKNTEADSQEEQLEKLEEKEHEEEPATQPRREYTDLRERERER